MLHADQGALDAQHPLLDGRQLRIGVVQARFNASITNALAQSCCAELLALGVAQHNIRTLTVPGALELPLALLALAKSRQFDALIALGCIIRGQTYHFELVANESAAGISQLGLQYQLPIANAVLTTENLAQALARQHQKGQDAARVAVEMAQWLKSI